MKTTIGKRTEEEYRKALQEQGKALKILNKIIRERDEKILELNKQISFLKNMRKNCIYKGKVYYDIYKEEK